MSAVVRDTELIGHELVAIATMQDGDVAPAVSVVGPGQYVRVCGRSNLEALARAVDFALHSEEK